MLVEKIHTAEFFWSEILSLLIYSEKTLNGEEAFQNCLGLDGQDNEL